MFSKILIANRGEIACRIIKTCRKLGIETAVVYSQADKECLHVKLADEAYLIGPPEPEKSYLRIDKIIETAKKCNAEAIHRNSSRLRLSCRKSRFRRGLREGWNKIYRSNKQCSKNSGKQG